ncbi:hypothetical protein P692DRAFT_201865114 [Suillus brevipes Sb2]|nr:hypothetical protein P692DRAFT_201865114 [Suillus brevipes Sb2]
MTDYDVPFSIDDFVDRLVTHVSSPRGWEHVGQRALSRSRRVAVPNFMYGPLSQRQSGITSSVPVNGTEQGETSLERNSLSDDDLKSEMLRIVRTVNTINLFRLVIDPRNFGRSVENLFHLSCLFHEGLCGFHIDADGEPIVCAFPYLN